MEVSKEKSMALRVLQTLARLRREYDNATPSLEEQGDAVYMDWAYRMGDAWEQAYAIVDALPSPHVDPIDTYKKPVEMEEEIRRNALTDGVALGEDGLCKSCGYAPWCRKNGRCYRSMQPLTDGVKGDGRG